MSEKTESPTPRRLRDARQRGDTPISAALVQASGFIAAWALLPLSTSWLVDCASHRLLVAVGTASQLDYRIRFSPSDLALDLVTLVGPMLALSALVAIGVGMAQTGGVFTVEPLFGGWTRLNPIQGMAKLFRPERLVSVVRCLLLAVTVGYLCLDLVFSNASALAAVTGHWEMVGPLAGHLIRRLGWTAALAGWVLGGVDLLLCWRAFLVRNRMTKDEVRREHRESEGNPEVKAARRRAHREMLANANILSVRDATVLVVNPTHLAIALRYRDAEDETPSVLGQGEGDLARRMIEAAVQYGIPVVQNVPLAHALYALETGCVIPEALYEAVAEVLREISQDDRQS